MSERFNEVLEEASKRVSEWPEWRKSEALKQSERLLKSIQTAAPQDDGESQQQKAFAAGQE